MKLFVICGHVGLAWFYLKIFPPRQDIFLEVTLKHDQIWNENMKYNPSTF